jgi:hypothetical protein
LFGLSEPRIAVNLPYGPYAFPHTACLERYYPPFKPAQTLVEADQVSENSQDGPGDRVERLTIG